MAAKGLAQVPGNDLRGVLDELLRRRQQNDKGKEVPVPLATFIMSQGMSVSGWVLAEREVNGRKTLLLQVPGPDLRQPNRDVCYLSLEFLQAIIVHEANLLLE